MPGSCSRRRTGGWIPAGLLLVALLAALAPPAAQAHAILVQADPPPGARLSLPPDRVRLWFSEPVEPTLTRVEVLDAERRRVDRGDLRADPQDPRRLEISLASLPPGLYTVVWQTVSRVDGHPARGFYTFAVGAGAIGPTSEGIQAGLPPIATAIRWLRSLALLLAFGLWTFHEGVLAPAGARVGPSAEPLFRLSRRMRLGAGGLVLGAAGLWAVGWASWTTQGLPPQVWGIALEQAGLRALITSGLALLATLPALHPRSAQLRRGEQAIVLLLFTGSLLSLSLEGHAAAGGDSLAVAADLLHRLGAGVWIGGLIGMSAALRVLQRLPPPERVAFLAEAVPRLSSRALLAVLGLAAGGIYRAAGEVGGLDRLGTTPYGRLLLLKSALFLAALVLAAWNRFRMRPRFGAASPAATAALPAFRALVGGEALLAAAIVALAAGLADLPPPRTLPGTVGEAAWILLGRPATDIRLQLTLTPARAPNRFDIEVRDPMGRPLPDLQRVILELTPLEAPVGTRRVVAQAEPDGRFHAVEPLTWPGLWRIRVIVRRQGREDVSSVFPLDLPGASSPREVDPEALEWLRRADTRMNRLKSVRMREELNDGEGRAVWGEYEFQAPDRMRVQLEGGSAAILIGKTQYVQEGGRWTALALAEPFRFPDFHYAESVEVAHVGPEEVLEGNPTRVIVARGRAGGLAFAFWIDRRDFRLHQVLMAGLGHLMAQRYFDFDAPLSVEPP
jgi:copper transport protein